MSGWPHRDHGCGLGCAAFGQHENHTKVSLEESMTYVFNIQSYAHHELNASDVETCPTRKLALGFS
jgi:hypothetical protein